MVTLIEAQQIVLNSVQHLDTEKITILDSLNRILASDVLADTDMPAFDKSAMDGYACQCKDVAKPLTMLEIISAGQDPTKIISEGFCSKIMTGAKVPMGADCVIKIEDTQIEGNLIRYTGDIIKNTNIRYIGEEYKKSDLLLKKGHKIRPQDIALMCAVGYIEPLVYKQPKVAILVTGDELVEPNQIPIGSHIRNSNAMQMLSQLKGMGINASYLGIIPDERDTIKSVLNEIKDKFDLIISSGGVSMGDYDYVPLILQELNFDIKIHGVNIKPGKPILFAQNTENISYFGMPGNPVSSFVQFELMVKSFLYKLQGHVYKPRRNQGQLLFEKEIKKIKKDQYIPVKVTENNQIIPLTYQGSAHIAAFVMVDALMEIPSGSGFLKNGDQVYVRYL